MKISNLFFICFCFIFNIGSISAQNCGKPLNASANINLSGFYATQSLSKGQIARKTITGSGIEMNHTLEIVTTTGNVSFRIVAVVKGGTVNQNYVLVGSCQTVSVGGKSITPLQLPPGTTELRYEIIATDAAVKVEWKYR